MEIDQNGPMTFSISQSTAGGSGIDVDFALWGPFTSLAAGCGGSTFPPSFFGMADFGKRLRAHL